MHEKAVLKCPRFFIKVRVVSLRLRCSWCPYSVPIPGGDGNDISWLENFPTNRGVTWIYYMTYRSLSTNSADLKCQIFTIHMSFLRSTFLCYGHFLTSFSLNSWAMLAESRSSTQHSEGKTIASPAPQFSHMFCRYIDISLGDVMRKLFSIPPPKKKDRVILVVVFGDWNYADNILPDCYGDHMSGCLSI